MHARIQAMFNRAKQNIPRGVAKSRAKHENLIQNECENRSDAKQSLQEEPFSAQSVKTTIFCTAQDGNTPPKRRS